MLPGISCVHMFFPRGDGVAGALFPLGPGKARGACWFIFLATVWLVIDGAVCCNVLSRPLPGARAGGLNEGGFQAWGEGGGGSSYIFI